MNRKRLDKLARLTRGAAVLSAAAGLAGGAAACANSGSTTTAPVINSPPAPPDPSASAQTIPSIVPTASVATDGEQLPTPVGSGPNGRPRFIPINAPPRPIVPPASSNSQP